MTPAAQHRPDPGGLLPLLAILALALAVRVIGLSYSLWYDEIASMEFARTPLRRLWSGWMIRETNPPLYYSLLGGWTALFGDGDAAARSLSVVIGMAGVVFAYLVGRAMAGRRAGLIAAALLALSAQHVLYSQQVRGYVLAHTAALAAILGVLLFLRETEDSGPAVARRRALMLYAAACVTALYSHTTLVLLPLLLNAYVAWRFLAARRARPLGAAAAEWVAANALVVLAWAWWGTLTVAQARNASNIGWIAPPSFPYAVRMTLESYASWGFGLLQLPAAAVAAAVAGWGAWAARSRGGLMLALLAAGTPVLLFVLSRAVPVFLPRTVYFAAGAFAVLAGVGVAALPGRAARAGVLALLVAAQVAGLAAWWPRREIEPWRALVRDVAATDPAGVVVTLGKGPAFAIRRYCRPPDCRLRVRTIPFAATDRWASGFPAIGPLAERAVPELLRREGRIATVAWVDLDAGRSVGRTGVREERPLVRYPPSASIGYAVLAR
ncbi:glycosyltransferase family 39 protein [uncultured Sphingomonas sp.]|uniref:glycosyltransferase family 39 protein n=1 Tax=uncultured Sphingomonas sp. TaxID=158754 RepID=UPI0035CAF829